MAFASLQKSRSKCLTTSVLGVSLQALLRLVDVGDCGKCTGMVRVWYGIGTKLAASQEQIRAELAAS